MSHKEETIHLEHFKHLQQLKIPYHGYVEDHDGTRWLVKTHETSVKLQTNYMGTQSQYRMVRAVYYDMVLIPSGKVDADTSLIALQNRQQDITGSLLSSREAQWYWSTPYPMDGLSFKQATERNKQEWEAFRKHQRTTADKAFEDHVRHAINTNGVRVVVATLSVPVAVITAAELALAAGAVNWSSVGFMAKHSAQVAGRGISRGAKYIGRKTIDTKAWGSKAAVSIGSQAIANEGDVDWFDVVVDALTTPTTSAMLGGLVDFRYSKEKGIKFSSIGYEKELTEIGLDIAASGIANKLGSIGAKGMLPHCETMAQKQFYDLIIPLSVSTGVGMTKEKIKVNEFKATE